jgi:hypothetical protein
VAHRDIVLRKTKLAPWEIKTSFYSKKVTIKEQE